MTLQELKNKLRLVNIHPIHIGGSPLEKQYSTENFIGDIEEYFEIAQVLGVKAIYIQTDILEDEEFHYNEEGSNPDNELEAIDLCSFDPLIKEFKKYLVSCHASNVG
ncbi:MAG: hypothetical protein NTY60_10655 [Proteobacteria bacterium]|nr:hypothetical protein [Pseudomonadota bacterium]